MAVTFNYVLDVAALISAALLTLKANWFDTLTVKKWEIVILNNDVSLFSATNEETLYEQLLQYCIISTGNKARIFS